MRRLSMTLALLLLLSTPASGKTLIRFATLAPALSPWIKILKRIARQIKKDSNGRIVMKIYAGGRQGDEKDVVRKIRTGQLQASSLTTVGMGEIDKHTAVLGLPFMFMRYSELDYVREKMRGYFEKRFWDRGFKILSWGDIGFLYQFSQLKIRTLAEYRQAKSWVWIDSPVAMAFARLAKGNAKTLPLSAVLTGLKMGIVNTVVGSPLAVIALQWFTRLKYISSEPLGIGVGCTVISRKTWESMPLADRQLFVDRQGKLSAALRRKIRKDSRTALKVLIRNGLEIVKPTPSAKREFRRLGLLVHDELAGKLYPRSLLQTVRDHLRDFRKSKGR